MYKLKLTDIQPDPTSKINIFYDKEIWLRILIPFYWKYDCIYKNLFQYQNITTKWFQDWKAEFCRKVCLKSNKSFHHFEISLQKY